MKIRITKRDVKIFFLGVLVMFLFLLIYDWQDFIKGLKEGYKAGTEEVR